MCRNRGGKQPVVHHPIALSLFSGAGGMDLGVFQAGFDILASIDIDRYCCETLREWVNHKHRHTQVIEADIRAIDPADLMDNLGLQSGELDLLFGGPPCQAFSQIGKRASLNDERGMLLFEMVRFAEVFRPQAILIEQVKGLLSAPDSKGKPGGVFHQLLRELERLGYALKWQIVNAADFGVPQLRQRIFIVGLLVPKEFHFPSPTHVKASHATGLFPLPAYKTVGDALQEIGTPPVQNGVPSEGNHIDITPQGDRRRIQGVPEGSHLAAQHHLPAEQRRNLSKKDTTKFRRLSREEPALTLRCGEIFFHPIEDRYLTPYEYMRLHGYPNEYILKGPIRGRSGTARYIDQHRQVANSVPPPVAKILAQSLLRTLECQKSLNIRQASLNSQMDNSLRGRFPPMKLAPLTVRRAFRI
ncbi:MAG TPA: DNA cytosine methyltransferase [Ktedonobacteraceae bacterium]|nr:DNA cytosine methyltransferase [Ktedonobacteraceae bacterium]